MIKKRLIIVTIALVGYISLFACSHKHNKPSGEDEKQNTKAEREQQQKVEKKWELAGLKNPESVLYDKENNVLYISNVNGQATEKDGNGFISKVSPNGKFITEKWITGLNAPKGLVKYNDKLYVSDIDQLVEISIKEGNVLHKYDVAGASFLNDTAVDKDGNVYISNTLGFSAIYKLSNGEVSTWIKDEHLKMPNGLFAEDGILYVASWGDIKGFDPKTYATEEPGCLFKISLTDKKMSKIYPKMGNLDGLEKTDQGFYISDYLAGELKYYDEINKKLATLIKDLPSGSADIGLNRKEKIVYIPEMNDNKIVAYFIKNNNT